MIIIGSDDISQQRIKNLSKEIEEQLKQWKEDEALRLRFRIAHNAWSETMRLTGVDCDILYGLRLQLEFACLYRGLDIW